MNHLSTTAMTNDEAAIADGATAAHIGDDYEDFKKFLAEEEESLSSMDTTGSSDGIAFSNRHYATDEEADAAHEAFLREVWEVPDGNA